MRDPMLWKRCTDEFVRRVEADPEKVKSIIKTAQERREYLRQIPVADKHVSFVVEGFYEVIKELLTALLLSKGLRSRNHQCLISYFYHSHPEHEAEAHLISQMSYLRNRLNYYGEAIEPQFYNKNKEEIERIITILIRIIK